MRAFGQIVPPVDQPVRGGDIEMTLFCTVLATSGLALALSFGAVHAQPAGRPMQTLRMPATPAPARVSLDPKTTALLLLDYVDQVCNPEPRCTGEMTPAMTAFMARVRKAGLTVAYGTRAPRMNSWLPGLTPMAGDIKVINTAQDRFYNTDLDKELKAKGIKMIIMSGWRITGSMTYTSVGAMTRGYTVVIPMDTTSAPTDYETTIGFFNVLNSGTRNLANTPLKPKAVTLTRTDMITFQ
jgi:Isochorismatase family